MDPWSFPDWTRHWDDVPLERRCTVTFRMGSDISTAVRQLAKYRRLCMRTLNEPADSHMCDDRQELWDEEFLYSEPYAVEDGINADELELEGDIVWGRVGFEMCQADDFECL